MNFSSEYFLSLQVALIELLLDFLTCLQLIIESLLCTHLESVHMSSICKYSLPIWYWDTERASSRRVIIDPWHVPIVHTVPRAWADC